MPGLLLCRNTIPRVGNGTYIYIVGCNIKCINKLSDTIYKRNLFWVLVTHKKDGHQNVAMTIDSRPGLAVDQDVILVSREGHSQEKARIE